MLCCEMAGTLTEMAGTLNKRMSGNSYGSNPTNVAENDIPDIDGSVREQSSLQPSVRNARCTGCKHGCYPTFKRGAAHMTCNGMPVLQTNHMMQLGRHLTYGLHRGDKQAVVCGEAAELAQ